MNADVMDTHQLNSFVTWQRSVQLAAEILKLSQTSQPRTQRFFDDLADTAAHYAASLGYNYLSLEVGFGLYATVDSGALALYARLKTAEAAGLLPEREIRRLLAMFDEVERMMEKYVGPAKKFPYEDAERTKIKPDWRKEEDFKPLNGSKYPRPGTGK